MGWQDIFTKKRIIVIAIAIVVAVVGVEAYVSSPGILLWINPENSVSITDVAYPPEAYRSQNLPITVYLSNVGDSKEVLLELSSKDNSVLSSNIQLNSATANTTIWLPLKTAGEQGFSLKVTWIGPGGFWQNEQASADKTFKVLAADYETSSPTKIASRAQGFDWTATIKNTGNTPADLTIQLYKKDPFILSDNSGGTQQISSIQVGETRTISFHFDVPSDASLQDHTMTLSFTTNYPDTSYYKDCKETTYHDYNVTVQENPLKTQLDSAGYWMTAVLGLAGISGIGGFVALLMGKRRR
jgi:hypothetical protein